MLLDLAYLLKEIIFEPFFPRTLAILRERRKKKIIKEKKREKAQKRVKIKEDITCVS